MSAVPPSSHRWRFCGHHFLFHSFTAYALLSVATEMPSVSVTMETTGDTSNHVGTGTSRERWGSGDFHLRPRASAFLLKFGQKQKSECDEAMVA